MDDNDSAEKKLKTVQAFFVKAAIDERGPQKLKIVPSYHQYLVYNEDDDFIACIQFNEDDDEWERIEGAITNGVAASIGQKIIPYKDH